VKIVGTFDGTRLKLGQSFSRFGIGYENEVTPAGWQSQ
jgi:hypothetical protein